MILDTIQAFDVLGRYGIHVARSKYVDSAEDAIAFAARRNAENDRSVSILLREIPLSERAPLVTSRLENQDAIRRAYNEFTPKIAALGGHVLAQAAVEPGTDIAIEGYADAALGNVIVLRSGNHQARQMAPLGKVAIEALISGFRAHNHRPDEAKSRNLLRHLLIRVSAFFEKSGVESFQLDPVRLHENSYTVLGAQMSTSQHLHLPKRLEQHAHDRKSYEYHPSGSQ